MAATSVMGGITSHVTHFRQVGILHHWYGWLFAAFYEFPCADELPDDFCKEYVVKEYARDHGVIVAAAHPHLGTRPSRIESKKKS